MGEGRLPDAAIVDPFTVVALTVVMLAEGAETFPPKEPVPEFRLPTVRLPVTLPVLLT